MNMFTAKLDHEIEKGKTLTQCREWQELAAHYDKIKSLHMRDLFAMDAKRFDKFSLQCGDLLFDYSKHRITEETICLLVQLAQAAGVKEAAEAMYAGKKINWTENRAVLHIALRNRSNTPIMVDGKDVMPEVNAVLAKMKRFCDRSEEHTSELQSH